MTATRRLLLAAAFACVAALLEGCGIPNDREPHDLEPAPGTSTAVQP